MLNRKIVFGCLVLTTSLVAPLAAGDDGDHADANLHNMMEEVVVVASKIPRPLSRVASQVTTIHRDELLAQQAQTLGDIARYEPTLDAEYGGNRFGSTGLSIRGVGGNRVAMQVDGVPLPRLFALGEFALNARSSVDPQLIERVEVLRGPASALYGSDALGGVVSITTIDPASLIAPGNVGYLGISGGWFSESESRVANLHSAIAMEDSSLVLSLDSRRGSERENRASSATLQDDSNYAIDHSMVKWQYAISDISVTSVIVDQYERKVDSDLRAVLGFGRQYANSLELLGDDKQQRRRLSVHFDTIALGLDKLQLLGYWQENKTRQDTQDLRGDRMTSISTQIINRSFEINEEASGAKLLLNREFTLGQNPHLVVAGVEWRREILTESRDGSLLNLSTGDRSKMLPPGEVLPARDLPITTTEQIGVFIQDEWQLGALTLIPALRWDHHSLDAELDSLISDETRLSDFDERQLTVKMGGTWALDSDRTMYIQYAQGFRSPPAEDVNLYLDYSGVFNVRALPNPELDSESSTNWELGYRQFGTLFQFDTSVYHSTYDDFIESRVRVGVDPADGTLLFQSRNISESTIYGAEFSAQLAPGVLVPKLRNWKAELGLHWSRGRDDATDEGIESVSPSRAVLALRWRARPNLNVMMLANYRARQRDIDSDLRQIYVPKPSTVLDVSIEYAPTDWLDIHLGVNNVSDKKYYRYQDVRQLTPDDPRVELLSRPGRNVALTFHIQFP